MSVSRRKFLGHAAAAVTLGTSGVYGLLDSMAPPASAAPPPPPRRIPAPAPPPPPTTVAPPPPVQTAPGGAGGGEQYLFQRRIVTINGIDVVSPPLHHAVVTAALTGIPTVADQASLEAVMASLESQSLITYTAAGGGAALAWGNPYFNRLPSTVVDRYMPIDERASAQSGQTVRALTDAISFASDPASLVLESNDVALVVASDSLTNVNAIIAAVFNGSIAGLFKVTSIRRGFVDATQLGGSSQSITKQLALAAGVPGAALIPNQAELFLGFTSTQRKALAPSNVSNLETLPGITDQWPNGYFVQGTTMHLSHIKEDLVSWYTKSYANRFEAAFSSSRPVPSPQSLTVDSEPPENETQVEKDFAKNGYVGHSSSIQPISRLGTPVRDNYGVLWAAGTAIPSRADFNTVDSPFAYSSNPTLDGFNNGATAGVHFVAFVPTSGIFDAMRKAMDGQYSDRSLGAAAAHGPFNSVLSATHRQNFLVPPRLHRSFPLVELT